jgi:hypothetical protein
MKTTDLPLQYRIDVRIRWGVFLRVEYAAEDVTQTSMFEPVYLKLILPVRTQILQLAPKE